MTLNFITPEELRKKLSKIKGEVQRRRMNESDDESCGRAALKAETY